MYDVFKRGGAQMKIFKFLEEQRMKILKGLSIISASVVVILFIRRVWLYYAPNVKKRYARVYNP